MRGFHLMRKKLLFLTITSALLIIGDLSTNPVEVKANFITEQLTSNNMKKAQRISKRVHNINNSISHQLFKDDKQVWTKFIRKINYLKNNQLEIYVTTDFKNLSHDKRDEIISRVQQLSLISIEKFKGVSLTRHITGLPANIFCDSNFIGRTEFLNSKDLDWEH